MSVDAAIAPEQWPALADRYLHLLLERERPRATQLIHDLIDQGADIRDIYLEIFQASQREIGQLWQTNQVTVAQEHYCTAATQQIISQLYPHIFAASPGERKMVMACASAELHELGARIVADFFELEAWNTYYLGANVPADSILSEVRATGAHVLGLSVSLPDKVPLVAEIIEGMRQADLEHSLAILVGGRPFNLDSELWQKVGADGYAPDARQAIAVADGQVPAG
ncbi:MAG: cobalamin B12-binding domain-containing protein [Chloroflexota bacterium]